MASLIRMFFHIRKELAPVISNGLWFPMEKFRTVINLAIWATAAAFAAFRIGTSDALMVGMIEGLMVLIVAFVAHKTLDLLIMTASKKEDE